MNLLEHQRRAWDGQVGLGNEWTRPVGPEVIEEARRGRWSVLLTEQRPVPREWFPAGMRGLRILCLASGGGQLDAGFRLTALYEDRHRGLRVAEFMPTYVATRAVKP